MRHTPLTNETVEHVGKHGARWLRSRYASWILAAISFTESVFAPILIDPFLVALIFAKRTAWIRYIVISIVFSVLGGLVGYMLGALFYDFIGTRVVAFYGFEAQFSSISTDLDSNGFVFVLIGALTPIPYKLVALASGVVQVDILTFLFASIFGRILRLGLVGYAAYAVGPHALPLIQRNLLKLAYIFGAVLLLYLIFRLW